MYDKQSFNADNKLLSTQHAKANHFSVTSIFIFPQEVWEIIFKFVDIGTLLNVRFVNKTLYVVAAKDLFEHYNAQSPHPFKDGGLLNTFCEPFEKQDTQVESFSETFQNHCFQSFMAQRFSVQLGDSETLVQYIEHWSDQLQQKIPLNLYITEKELQICNEYVANQLARAKSRMRFLLNRDHLQRFLHCYDYLTRQVKGKINSGDYLFLAEYLQKAERLEAFLTLLVLFDKITPYKFEKRNEIMKCLEYRPWSGMLSGDGFMVLELSGTIPGALQDIVQIWQISKTNNQDREAAEYIAMKLRASDLLAYTQTNYFGIRDAVLAKQPQIIATLSQGSDISDAALIYLFKQVPKKTEFFNLIEKIPLLFFRFTSELFFSRFFTHISKEICDSINFGRLSFCEEILNRPAFVQVLRESDILLLAQYLPEGAHDNITRILLVLFVTNKLTGNLLEKLAKLRLNFKYPDAYAEVIGKSKEACMVLAKPENSKHAFEIAKIALSHFSRDKICPLLKEKIIENFTLDQRRSLHEIAKQPINQYVLNQYSYIEKPVLYPLEVESNSFPPPQEPIIDLENDLTAENEHKRLWQSAVNQLEANQGISIKSFMIAVAILAFFGLALVITGGALGGLGMITAPAMITLLTIGGFLLLSFIAIKCILKMRSTLDDTGSQSSFSNSSSDDDSPILPYNNSPTNSVIQVIPNAAVYIDVLHPESQPLIENKVNFYGPLGTNRQNEYKNS